MISGWIITAIVLGMGASLIMDGWAVLRWRVTGASFLDYGWLTRWITGLPAGRLSLSLGREAPLSTMERVIGWVLHYAIGVLYAGAFVMIVGADWRSSPSLLPALLFGAITAFAPFLILQPALGRGAFAARTPSPGAARLQTMLTHLVFGLGLYMSALSMGTLKG